MLIWTFVLVLARAISAQSLSATFSYILYISGGPKKYIRQEILGKTNGLLLVDNGPHRKRRVQQFLYCCVCIRCQQRHVGK
jgi:L-lactate utilization protein LutB